jgi:EpsI family protein
MPSLRIAVSCGLLLATLLGLQLRSAADPVALLKPLGEFPVVVGDWEGRESYTLEPKVLANLKLDDYLIRRYVDPAGVSVSLYVGYWSTQRKGAQIHSPRNCLPGSGWEPLEGSLLTVALPPPHPPITVNRYLIQKEREIQMVLYWYQARGTVTAGEVAAKLDMLRSSVLLNRTDAALVRVLSPVHGDLAAAERHLVRYVQALYPLLGEYLPG